MGILRFVTAASLFDGHDVSINIMRRLLQSKGVEVIHLGHNRPAKEIVDAAISEDAHALAISSYQGGHNEYFLYVYELLQKAQANKIKIFGGGGGVITPKEIKFLHGKGIDRIYSPEDGVKLGLEGIINDMIQKAQEVGDVQLEELSGLEGKILSNYQIGRCISYIENTGNIPFYLKEINTPVLGITGTGGAGKSSLIDELLLRIRLNDPLKKIALVSIDPSKKKTKGALLGDRIRLGSASYENFYIRSLATRDSQTELSPHIQKVISLLKTQQFDLILIETSGIGQASDAVVKITDKCLYVMTPEYGAQSQLEKIEMLESADFVVINKFERSRAEDALRDVRRQYRRNHKLFSNKNNSINDEDLPVYGTIASQFNDAGVNSLYCDLAKTFDFNLNYSNLLKKNKAPEIKSKIIPSARKMYLREIAQTCRRYNEETRNLYEKIRKNEILHEASILLKENKIGSEITKEKEEISIEIVTQLENFENLINGYKNDSFQYQVRENIINTKTKYKSLSGLDISKIALPKFRNKSDLFYFMREQNIPGYFPFAAGIFPFKRSDEEPKRMFAGEGGPNRTNKRFHFLSKDDNAKRLSTAFDSVTLYGEDPDTRPDIYGKIGESGVSIATLKDMEDLFSGFKLTDKNTSVSMTINGPAPIILAMFMNTAIKQTLNSDDLFDEDKRLAVIRNVRGTVQADILKEDQAQNTCIFSLDFALKLMGDVQAYFSINKIKNYYAVSISGYHIAEAGANPISQLAFTLANGFTYVEYYLSRGLHIDDFCPNLSFFFSNGLDPEYSVMGRVARKIWSVVMKYKYGANERSQKLKYHIQTSGRSLHAQEIDFNDIRTTLQAFLALSDNCNSLHTNAFDEAITTPTAGSVRRAMAIQMIINQEFGMNKTDNPLQGSFLIEELSHLVEDAVLQEFEKISDKGGVLEAMESMYQRTKIQEESLYYETLKDSGELPIIGVNTYLADNLSEQFQRDLQLTRSSVEEKNEQILRLNNFKNNNKLESVKALEKLKNIALRGDNIFEELLHTVNYCSLGQITQVLYEVGGKYRRNM